MDITDLQRVASIITPFALAWVGSLQARINKQSDQLSDLERRTMQMRVELQRDSVSRHEIERITAQMDLLINMVEQQSNRLERVAGRLEHRNG